MNFNGFNAHRGQIPLTFTIVMLSLLVISPSVLVNAKSPYDSGYDHGCDDAGISDSSDRYINQDEKGPSYHTSEFMDGYYSGINSCEGNSGEGYYEQPQQAQQDGQYYYEQPQQAQQDGQYYYEQPQQAQQDGQYYYEQP